MCHIALFEINVPSYSTHTIGFEIAGPCKNQQSLQSLVHKHNNKSPQWKWCQISLKWRYHALLFCLGLFLTDWSNREMINSLLVLNFVKEANLVYPFQQYHVYQSRSSASSRPLEIYICEADTPRSPAPWSSASEIPIMRVTTAELNTNFDVSYYNMCHAWRRRGSSRLLTLTGR